MTGSLLLFLIFVFLDVVCLFFPDVILRFPFQWFNYNETWRDFMFISLGLHFDFRIWWFIALFKSKLENFWPLFFQVFFLFLAFSSGNTIANMLNHLLLSHRSLRTTFLSFFSSELLFEYFLSLLNMYVGFVLFKVLVCYLIVLSFSF